MAKNLNSIMPHFSALSGISDYSNWKFLMKMYLIHEELWNCIEQPEDYKADSSKEQKTLAKICMMVQPSSFPHVRNAKTPKEAWDKLKEAYEDKGLCRRLNLLRNLFGLKLEQFVNMEEYLTKILEVAQQLSDINAALEDEFLAVIMLSGLPSDYDPMIMALENSGTKLNSDNVKCKLMQERLRRDSSNEGALFVRKFKPKCFRCKKTGHFIKDCKMPKNTDHQCNVTNEKIPDCTLLTALAVNVNSSAWYIDSGATCHMSNDKSLMSNFEAGPPVFVTVASGDNIESLGRGDVKVPLTSGSKTICDVIHVPQLTTNLLSVSKMTQKGLEVHFDSETCTIFDKNSDVVATATAVNGVYELDIFSGSTNTNYAGTASAKEVTQELWHKRLAHLNSRSMRLLKEGMAQGINYNEVDFKTCVACLEGKQSRQSFPKQSFNRAKEKLELIHTDLCGPMSEQSLSGAKYLLTFIDDFSRMTFGYFLKAKSEVLEVFIKFKTLIENEFNLNIKCIRSDNGKEYVNNKFQAYLDQHGIRHQTTVPYCPQQNGVAERANRTIIEAARCMLQEAKLAKPFWAEAVNTAIYIKNKSPSKAIRGYTPEELWYGVKVDLSHLRVFGCMAYCLIPDETRKKLDAKSKRCIFVGYCPNTKGYRLVDPDNLRKCIKSRDVVFMEDVYYESSTKECSEYIINSKVNQKSDNERPTCYIDLIETEASDALLDSNTISEPLTMQLASVSPERREEIDDTISGEEFLSTHSLNSPLSESVDNSDPNDPTWYPDSTDLCSDESTEMAALTNPTTTCFSENPDPTTVKGALSGQESNEWRAAMKDEFESFEHNKAWTLVNIPSGKTPVKCKWIFKKKRGALGEVLRYKARLVAKGFTQQYGVDYEETFSPVVRYSTIRLLLAVAAQNGLSVDHMDVKTAFLNGDLKEVVYMEQPQGYEVPGKEKHVYKLHKAIYGLKQASKAWYDKINNVLINLGFKKSLCEPCVYVRGEKEDLLIIALYVDDILLFSHGTKVKDELKLELTKKFEMKDLGLAKHILGMRLIQEEGNISLDQELYIKDMLNQFNMIECNEIATPLETGLKLAKGKEPDIHSKYRSLIGSIMYVAVCTRPDIAHAASYLSQFNNCNSDTHWKAAKRVLRYLKKTMHYKILFQKSPNFTITGYADADWGSDLIDRRSYTGYVFKIGEAAVSWESRKQRTVALSTAEAEYMALCDAAKEAMFIRNFFRECLDSSICIPIFNDNQSALKLCLNQMFHSKSKHIDLRHHFVRQAVSEGVIQIQYLSTQNMIADILTKALTSEKHYNCVKAIGLANL